MSENSPSSNYNVSAPGGPNESQEIKSILKYIHDNPAVLQNDFRYFDAGRPTLESITNFTLDNGFGGLTADGTDTASPFKESSPFGRAGDEVIAVSPADTYGIQSQSPEEYSPAPSKNEADLPFNGELPVEPEPTTMPEPLVITATAVDAMDSVVHNEHGENHAVVDAQNALQFPLPNEATVAHLPTSAPPPHPFIVHPMDFFPQLLSRRPNYQIMAKMPFPVWTAGGYSIRYPLLHPEQAHLYPLFVPHVYPVNSMNDNNHQAQLTINVGHASMPANAEMSLLGSIRGGLTPSPPAIQHAGDSTSTRRREGNHPQPSAVPAVHNGRSRRKANKQNPYPSSSGYVVEGTSIPTSSTNWVGNPYPSPSGYVEGHSPSTPVEPLTPAGLVQSPTTRRVAPLPSRAICGSSAAFIPTPSTPSFIPATTFPSNIGQQPWPLVPHHATHLPSSLGDGVEAQSSYSSVPPPRDGFQGADDVEVPGMTGQKRKASSKGKEKEHVKARKSHHTYQLPADPRNPNVDIHTPESYHLSARATVSSFNAHAGPSRIPGHATDQRYLTGYEDNNDAPQPPNAE